MRRFNQNHNHQSDHKSSLKFILHLIYNKANWKSFIIFKIIRNIYMNICSSYAWPGNVRCVIAKICIYLKGEKESVRNI